MFIFLLLNLPFLSSYFTKAPVRKYFYYKSKLPNILSIQSIHHPNYLLVKYLLFFFMILVHEVDHFHHALYHLIKTFFLQVLPFDFMISL